jgi:hypothetical protein
MAICKIPLRIPLSILAAVALSGAVFVIGKRTHLQWAALKSHLNAIQRTASSKRSGSGHLGASER